MSSGFATDTKEQIKQATDIVDLIGSYAQLRRSGSRYVCHCPWHDDQRPSLQINPDRQSWVCWVCNIRGDIFDFVMRKEGVEFVEAMKILAERAGIPLTFSQKKVVQGSPQDKPTLYRAMQWAVERFHAFLRESSEAGPARNYLEDRGFTLESIEQFRLGFAPRKWSWLADQARNTEFSLEVLEACDLVRQSDRTGSFYEPFNGRLLFPIFDTMNRPIAAGGRIVPGVVDEAEERGGKYVNSRETRLFSKSDTLYGLNFVKDQVSKSRALTIVEGYTDVIAAWQAGLRDVVACLGTALNHKHIRLIKRFADRITLVLDGDQAGRRRANEVVDLFVANDIDLRIITLPEGQDPNDFVQQHGSAGFIQLVREATDAIDHKIGIETAGIDLVRDTHAAHQALERILLTLSRIPPSVFSGSVDKILRQDQLLTRLARQFAVDREQVKKRLLELRSRDTGRNLNSDEQSPDRGLDFSKLLRREIELLQLLLQAPEHLDTVIENIPCHSFVEGPLRKLYEHIDDCFQTGEGTGFEDLMLSVECPELKNVLVYLDNQWQDKKSALDHQAMESDKALNEMIDVFRKLESESDNRRSISELHQQDLTEQEEISTLEELLNQTRQRHGL